MKSSPVRFFIGDKDKIKEFLSKNCNIVDGHWLWTGYVGKGRNDEYGSVTIIDQQYRINRLSAYVYLGLDLDDPKQQALHIRECLFKICFNPEHLYIGTDLDNKRDRNALILASPEYPCGHPRTPENSVPVGKSKACRFCSIDHWTLRGEDVLELIILMKMHKQDQDQPDTSSFT